MGPAIRVAIARNPLWSEFLFFFIITFALQIASVVIRDLSEISRGEGGWKQREGHNFLRPQKREGSWKMGR